MAIGAKSHDKENVTNGISLMVSILVRYPEISALYFDPKSHTLKFTFLVMGSMSSDRKADFQHILNLSLDVFHRIDGNKKHKTNIRFEDFDDVTRIEIIRNTETLSQEEISMIIQLVESNFPDKLVVDRNETMMEEDLLLQEEIIDTMLLDLKTHTQERNFIAYREDGRVMVFNM
jgi:hypothetical protein